MNIEVERALVVLKAYLRHGKVDRDEICAFALLWALNDHWPSKTTLEIELLLEASDEIFKNEKDRCYKQRKIALAKLATLET